MPGIGHGCHELRVQDEKRAWRLVYLVDADAIVILDVFSKTTSQTPKAVIDACKGRLKRFHSTQCEVRP
jgi:phage-related protein